jgi:hypothetical protein
MAHRQILESAAVGAHFLVEYHNRMNMAVPEPVLSAPKALEAHLTAAADGANVRYEDYEDWLTTISQQAVKLWNPHGEGADNQGWTGLEPAGPPRVADR